MRRFARPRKTRALSWLALLLAALLLFTATGFYTLLPAQTADRTAQTLGLEPVRVVERRWNGGLGGLPDRVCYLSDSRDYALLSFARFDLLTGWNSSLKPLVLDKHDSDQRLGLRGWYCLDSGSDWSHSIYLAGFVPYLESVPTLTVGYVGGEATTLTPLADIPVEGGHCFLEALSLGPPPSVTNRPEIVCTVTGPDGIAVSPPNIHISAIFR